VDDKAETVVVPFYGRFIPIKLRAGVECFYDVFVGDGTLDDFTLSATPVSLFDMTIGDRSMLLMDKIIYIKEKATTDEVAYFARPGSGWTLATNMLSNAIPPVTGKRIEVFSVKATV
jgi:hypothetical protein